MRVLITDPLSPLAPEMLAKAGHEADVQIGRSPEELRGLLADADAWLIRSGTRVTGDLLEAAPRLKVIGRAGVGVDNVDLVAATRRGILVINAPEGNTISTAEHTCAMIMALARQIPQAHMSLAGGAWERKRFAGSELEGKTLAVVGLGKIGGTVASRMRAFNMHLLGFDPIISPDAAERLGVTLVQMDELFERADIITVHTPLNDATRNLIDSEALQRCRKGVWIVNCARGGIVDEAALLDALESGHVGGAALDVFSQEPPGADLQALLRHPRVVVTPHIAASTGEAQEKVALQVVDGVIDALAGRPVATPVNAGAIRAAAQPEARPFIELADRLGQVAAQMSEGALQRVLVRCSGEVARRYADVLTVSALRGVMSYWRDVAVNLINAPVLAHEAGLQVEEQRASEPGDFTNLVEVQLDATGGSRVVKGTVFEESDARLVEVDGFRFEVRLEGYILLYRNVDRPGMVAAVGSILADENINIASLALARTGPGQEAVSAFSVDDDISRPVLDQIAAIDGVTDVHFVRLG
jgi:D-3-phosphoglycerate dehydrogenase / 2-oxoglutarate reductase